MVFSPRGLPPHLQAHGRGHLRPPTVVTHRGGRPHRSSPWAASLTTRCSRATSGSTGCREPDRAHRLACACDWHAEMMGLLDKLRRLLGPYFQPPSFTPPAERKPEPNPPRLKVTVERARPAPDLTGPRLVAGPEHESRYLSATDASELLIPGPDGELPVRIRDGFFQHVPSGKRVPPGNRTLNKHGLVSFRVRGDAYYDSKAADTPSGTASSSSSASRTTSTTRTPWPCMPWASPGSRCGSAT